MPSFGRWEYYKEDMCFSECFERARQRGGGGGGIHLSAAAAAAPCNSTQCYAGAPQDNDLYVAGDLYHNDFVTPAMIVVPRHTNQVTFYYYFLSSSISLPILSLLFLPFLYFLTRSLITCSFCSSHMYFPLLAWFSFCSEYSLYYSILDPTLPI